MIPFSIRNRSKAVFGLVGILTAASLIAAHFLDTASLAREPYKRVEKLLATETTILGQPIVYPTGEPSRVLAVIVTLNPDEGTGWHTHGVPLFGYLIEGELTVDYREHGKRVYKTGDSLVEAINTPHNGRNTGAGPVRIMAVFMGAEGAMNTTKVETKN